MIAPTFDELSNKYPNLKFIKVDVDKCKETKNKYMVNAMPTFLVLINGQRVDILTGADAGALSNLVHKWSVNCPTQVSSPIPGQHDILHFIDKGQCECLNEKDTHPLRHLLDGNGPLVSDCDEQLLINLPFVQPVKIHSILFRGPAGGKGPKNVKIFANIPVTLGFDAAQSSEPVQTVDFSQEHLIALKYVKFQNIHNIQLFVEDNIGGGEQTVIEEFRIFGTPLKKKTTMPPVNVDNLMRELSIDQLIQVQIKLRNETENKREDLRQMVGRRYRDVLDASNAVKRLTEIASELSILLNDTKRSFSAQQNSDSTCEYTKRTVVNAGRCLLLLHTLLPLIV
uniref:PITH domain-containing protein n=1 Tax=Meloidogyne javanica TaxID=6303 RepID=A0A915MTA7_MELJA